MGQFDQGVETQLLCHFAWCIARLVAPVQKLIQQIFFLQVDKLSGGSLQKNYINNSAFFIFANNCSKQALSLSLETGECGYIEA